MVPPKIVSIAPDHAPSTGGKPVTITGEGFGAKPTVMFGEREAPIVKYTPAAQAEGEGESGDTAQLDVLETTAPAQAQAGPVVVSVDDGSGGRDFGAFTYQSRKPMGCLLAAVWLVYLGGMLILGSYLLVALWPPDEPPTAAAPTPEATATASVTPAASETATPNANGSSGTTSIAAVAATEGGSSNAGGADGDDNGSGDAEEDEAASESGEVSVFRWFHGVPPRDLRLLLIAGAAGVVGATGYGFIALARWLGRKEDDLSWSGYYFARPFAGFAVAVIIYLVARGGLVVLTTQDANGGGSVEINVNSVAALGGLAGLMTMNALQILDQIFKAVFRFSGGSAQGLDDEDPSDRPPPRRDG